METVAKDDTVVDVVARVMAGGVGRVTGVIGTIGVVGFGGL